MRVGCSAAKLLSAPRRANIYALGERVEFKNGISQARDIRAGRRRERSISIKGGASQVEGNVTGVIVFPRRRDLLYRARQEEREERGVYTFPFIRERLATCDIDPRNVFI